MRCVSYTTSARKNDSLGLNASDRPLISLLVAQGKCVCCFGFLKTERMLRPGIIRRHTHLATRDSVAARLHD